MWEAIAEGDKQGVLVLRTPEKRDVNIPHQDALFVQHTFEVFHLNIPEASQGWGDLVWNRDGAYHLRQ